MSSDTPEQAPSFERDGFITRHGPGCRCWPHVSEKDAQDAIAAVGLAEYRDGLNRPPADTPLDDAWKAAEAALPEGWVLDGLYHLFDHVGNEPSGWLARAVGPGVEGMSEVSQTTPAAALLALAEKLTRA